MKEKEIEKGLASVWVEEWKAPMPCGIGMAHLT